MGLESHGPWVTWHMILHVCLWIGPGCQAHGLGLDVPSVSFFIPDVQEANEACLQSLQECMSYRHSDVGLVAGKTIVLVFDPGMQILKKT